MPKVEGNAYLHVLKVERKYPGEMSICTSGNEVSPIISNLQGQPQSCLGLACSSVNQNCSVRRVNRSVEDFLLLKVERNEYLHTSDENLHVLKVQRKYSGVMTIYTCVKLNVNTETICTCVKLKVMNICSCLKLNVNTHE